MGGAIEGRVEIYMMDIYFCFAIGGWNCQVTMPWQVKNDQEVIVRNVVGLAEDLHLKDGL